MSTQTKQAERMKQAQSLFERVVILENDVRQFFEECETEDPAIDMFSNPACDLRKGLSIIGEIVCYFSEKEILNWNRRQPAES